MSNENMTPAKTPRKVSTSVAILAIIILAIIFSCGFAIIKFNTMVVFLTALIFAMILGLAHGYSLADVENFFIDGCKNAVMPSAILFTVGAVIGAWIVSGIVPTIVYYGLKILTPSTFLISGFIICCIISFFTGSSYTAISTIGIALLGIGMGLGIHAPITAGMVVSGALFGDKMSPFSDSTNLAAAVSGINVFEHINSMLYTTTPAFLISAILYFVLGLRYSNMPLDLEKIEAINSTLSSVFNISPILLIVPIITIVLAIKKVPPVTALIISALLGIIAAFIFQGGIYDFKTIVNSLGAGFSIETELADVNKLLSRGGMSGMMGNVLLAFLCLGMAGVLQKIGMLDSLLSKMSRMVARKGGLVLTTLGMCAITTLVCASQYVAILLPGQVMSNAYDKLNIKRKVLSRSLEDCGTVLCFIIPWTTSGVYVSGVLGVDVLSYAPYTFFCFLCPLMAIIYAITGKFIWNKDEGEAEVLEN